MWVVWVHYCYLAPLRWKIVVIVGNRWPDCFYGEITLRPLSGPASAPHWQTQPYVSADPHHWNTLGIPRDTTIPNDSTAIFWMVKYLMHMASSGPQVHYLIRKNLHKVALWQLFKYCGCTLWSVMPRCHFWHIMILLCILSIWWYQFKTYGGIGMKIFQIVHHTYGERTTGNNMCMCTNVQR